MCVNMYGIYTILSVFCVYIYIHIIFLLSEYIIECEHSSSIELGQPRLGASANAAGRRPAKPSTVSKGLMFGSSLADLPLRWAF